MSMLLLLGAAPGVTRLNKSAPPAQRVRGTEGYGAERGAQGASIGRSRYRGRFLLARSRFHRQHDRRERRSAPPVGMRRAQGQAR
jgi:hypothetical protein